MIALAVVALAVLSGPPEYERANRLFQQHQYAEAGVALDLAIKEDPKYVPAWTLRGKLAMVYSRFDFARAAFLRAVDLDPQSPNAQFMLGFFYYVDNDFSKAVPVLETAARLNPKDPRALLYLAMSQEGLAHPDLAAALYRQTIQLETETGKPNPETHTAYGRLLFTLGDYEQSAQQAARVLELDPASRDGHYETGRLAFEKGDYAKAAAEGELALAHPGEGTLDRQVHFLLTRAYSKLGNRALAESHRKLFEAAPPTLRR